MQPQSPYTSASGPTNLPPVMPQGQLPPVPTAAPAPQPAPAASVVSPTDQAVAQAKQAIAQYKNSPYQLSLALQQVKTAYIASHFSVIVNPVED